MNTKETTMSIRETCESIIYELKNISFDELGDWMNENSLGDIRIETNLKREFLGGKVLIAYGGPNIWLSTNEINAYWGNAEVSLALPSSVRDMLYDWFKDMWELYA